MGGSLLFATIDDGREDAAYDTHLLRCSAGVTLLVMGVYMDRKSDSHIAWVACLFNRY